MKRNKNLDIIRGVAIILMVLGHCIQYGNGTEFSKPEIFFNNKIFQLIYSFHMPLFMLVSGYLFAFTAQKCNRITDFIKNRILRLLLPIAGWQAVMYLLYAFGVAEHNRWEENWVLSYVKSLPREFWFLWAVFYCSVAVWIGKYLFRDSTFYYLFGLILTFLVPDIVYNLSYYKFMYPFFIGGYLVAENGEIIKNKLSSVGQRNLFLILLTGYLVLFLFWNYDSFIYTSGYTLLGRNDALRQFGIDCYRTVTGFVGSVVVVMAANLIHGFIICKFDSGSVISRVDDAISRIGEKSLGIYIISGKLVEMFLIKNLDKLSVNYFNNILQTMIILGISYLLTTVINKIPILNSILLGGRKAKCQVLDC